MAKKISRKKTTRKNTTKKATKKATGKKTTAKKSTTKKAARKKTAKKTSTAKSTTKKNPAKKSTARKTETGRTAKNDQAKTKTHKKSKLKKSELKHYQQMLLAYRAIVLRDLNSMSSEALEGHSNLSNVPLHMADVGSDCFEMEQTLSFVELDNKLLEEIDQALERIEAGTYGICEVSGEPIPKIRLDIMPWARYTIDVARKMEKNGRR